MTDVMEGQVDLFDRDTWSGRTSPEHSAATEGKTSRRSSRKSSGSQSRKPPMFLCLTRDGQNSGFSWETDGASAGEYMTRNIGVYPSEENASRLSQILEDTAPEKYRLSQKACQGILRRAARRGKELPEELKAALETQANQMGMKASPTVCKGTESTEQTRQDATAEGGEKTKAIRSTQSTDLPCAYAETLGTANPNGYTSETELGTACQATNPADKAETEFCFEPRSQDGVPRVHGAESPTLNTSQGGQRTPCIVSKVIGIDHVLMSGGTTFQGRGWYDNVSGCLKTQAHGVLTYEKNDDPEDVSEAKKTSYTLQIRGCCEGGGKGALVQTEKSATLGTSQTQTLIQIPKGFAMQAIGEYADTDVGSACKARDYKDATDLVVSAVDCRSLRETAMSGTLQAKENGGQSLNYQNPVRVSSIVRRLTPMECERLQGFPDGWSEKGILPDGTEKEMSDSTRYKLQGNSIALPYWRWMLKRIAGQYERTATLGSLFDGQGGFPVCWAEVNGPESCRWSSEIDQNAEAVVRKHFGDEDRGVEGDFWEAKKKQYKR